MTDNRQSTTVSNQFITPENTFAEIQKHAESCGVFMDHAPANVVKDSQGAARTEQLGHYQLIAEQAYQLTSFLDTLRQRSYRVDEVSGIRPWLKVIDFTMPAARVTVTHVVLGQADNQPPPVAALLSFVPDTDADLLRDFLEICREEGGPSFIERATGRLRKDQQAVLVGIVAGER